MSAATSAGVRDQVVAGEDGVVDDRQQDGERELRGRKGERPGPEIVRAHRAQLDAQHLEGDEEEHEPHEHRKRLPHSLRHPRISAFLSQSLLMTRLRPEGVSNHCKN
jgi:hypothetical protein